MNFEVQYLGHSILALFGFSFFITHHSSLNFRHSSFITHHLKYPNFPNPTRLAHVFSFLSLNFFYFLWDHTWAPYQTFLLAYPPHTISSFHIVHCSFPFSIQSPILSQNQRLQPRHSFFFFSLQPPIPTTTTSVLSLKHKPKKFISILEAPRKFTNPQQPIHCPNCWFYFLFFIFFMGLRWERWKWRKKKKKKKEENPETQWKGMEKKEKKNATKSRNPMWKGKKRRKKKKDEEDPR